MTPRNSVLRAENGVVYLRLGSDLVMMIDESDLPIIAQYKWTPRRYKNRSIYAIANIAETRPDKVSKQRALFLQRILLDAPEGVYVGHINGNGLDNRRCNLRIMPVAASTSYRRAARSRERYTSTYKGVSYTRDGWRAAVKHNGVVVFKEHFPTEMEAVLAYNDVVSNLPGGRIHIVPETPETVEARARLQWYKELGCIPRNPILKCENGVATLRLRKNQLLTVDESDLPTVAPIFWALRKTPDGPVADGSYYAVGTVRVTEPNAAGRTDRNISIHRLITGAPAGSFVDHIDFNGLNNCRSNLRLASPSQNSMWRRLKPGKTSKHRGVAQVGARWVARLFVKRKLVYREYFDTEREAAIARNEAAKKFHGEFAMLNAIE